MRFLPSHQLIFILCSFFSTLFSSHLNVGHAPPISAADVLLHATSSTENGSPVKIPTGNTVLHLLRPAERCIAGLLSTGAIHEGMEVPCGIQVMVQASNGKFDFGNHWQWEWRNQQQFVIFFFTCCGTWAVYLLRYQHVGEENVRECEYEHCWRILAGGGCTGEVPKFINYTPFH